jgi:hypothetical protein
MSTPCSRTRAAIFHHLRDTTADRLPADIIVVWLVLITLHDDRDSLAPPAAERGLFKASLSVEGRSWPSFSLPPRLDHEWACVLAFGDCGDVRVIAGKRAASRPPVGPYSATGAAPITLPRGRGSAARDDTD